MRSRHRAALLSAFALFGLLTLASCGGEDAAEAEAETEADDAEAGPGASSEDAQVAGSGESEEAESEVQLESGAAAELTQIPDLEFTEVEQNQDTVIANFDQAVTVTQTHQSPRLPIEIAEQIAAEHPGSSQDMPEGATEVSAADGEVFVVAVVKSDDPQWESADARPSVEDAAQAAIRVSGNEVTELSLDLSAGSQITVALSVPEEAGAEDVVLETLSGQISQEISLIDGTRADSDVEHIYSAPTEVEIGEDATWSEDYETPRGSMTHSGQLTEGLISPMVPEFGWANPGNVFLGLNLSTQELPFPHIDNSTVQLQLADGSTVQPEAQPSGSGGQFADTAWFQLPADAQEAAAVISIDTQLGPDEYEVGTVKVPLSFTAGGESAAGETDAGGAETDAEGEESNGAED